MSFCNRGTACAFADSTMDSVPKRGRGGCTVGWVELQFNLLLATRHHGTVIYHEMGALCQIDRQG